MKSPEITGAMAAREGGHRNRSNRVESSLKALDSGFTRATRLPFGPASLFARSARSRPDDARKWS
jgi:hypothetical protein